MNKNLSSVAVSDASIACRFFYHLRDASAAALVRSKGPRVKAMVTRAGQREFEKRAGLVQGSPGHPGRLKGEIATVMEDHLKHGLNLFMTKKYRAAEQELRKALLTCPDISHVHSLVAVCLSEQGRTKEALREAKEGVRRGSDNHYAHFAVSAVYFDLGDLKRAKDAINEAIRLNSRDPSCFARAADICLAEQNWDDAILMANRGLMLDPKHISCINARAMALIRLGQPQDAAEGLTMALYLKPEDAETQANLGWLSLTRNEVLEAFDHFSESLKLNPNNRWASEGVVHALKARHALCYPIMAPCYWASRGSWQWMSRLRLIPLLDVVRFLFATVSYAAHQIFNLLLRLDSLGRTIINKREIESNNRFIGLSFLALALLVNVSFKDIARYFHINTNFELTAVRHLVQTHSEQPPR